MGAGKITQTHCPELRVEDHVSGSCPAAPGWAWSHGRCSDDCRVSVYFSLSLSYSKVGLCYPRYLLHFPLPKADLRWELTCARRCLRWYMQGINNKQKHACCNHAQTLRRWEGFTERKFKGFQDYSFCIICLTSGFPVKGRLSYRCTVVSS